MNPTRLIASFLLVSTLFTSCVTTTMIRSFPENANLNIDGRDVGKAPYRHQDSKVSLSTTEISLTMDGYRTLNTFITKDEEVDIGPAIAGFFVFIPWLWALKYEPSYTFTLKPEEVKKQNIEPTILVDPQDSKTPETSKAQRLRELKALLDEGILTQEEFDEQKKKILLEH
ncbi:SHOCT domain-containing protein [Bacteroidia bacterium]|nr:SHOCT domain-containing protein [Bacteroidia bacterium]MDB9882541.1 SHOCT domain-containing protein [Bacteroidia bacterium]MDC1395306.1 SHOCT domain-containing protein [Bacteroidia bacterium]